MSPALFRVGAAAALISASLTQRASPQPHRLAPVADATLAARGAGFAPRGGNGFRGQGGGRGFGFGNAPDQALVSVFDADENGRLNASERRAAREYAEQLGLNRGRGGRGAFWGTPEAGRRIAPSSIRQHPTTPLYNADTLRTIFLTFENDDWERELMAFKRTDIDVPATLTVDGEEYEDVGVQFHGNSSFSSVPIGLKHSMRIAIDFAHDKQDVDSYNTLLLLNSHEDASFLRTVLALEIARDYIPAPKANFVRLVINGENWGVYVNQQQFNKDLTKEQFGTAEGARWKVQGNPGSGRGGLTYLGDDPAAYKTAYEIKSKDEERSWAALMNLTRVLNETPADQLEFALAPLLDIEGTLKFLAVDIALANSDGYWTRASDYSLFMEPSGRFHILPYDVNSTFAVAGGRGFGRSGSVDLHPLQAANDFAKPLASRLLAVPTLREKYRGYLRDIATKWLDWRRLGPIVGKYHAMIDAEVKADTKKLEGYEEFVLGVDELREFAERRREYLLGITGDF